MITVPPCCLQTVNVINYVLCGKCQRAPPQEVWYHFKGMFIRVMAGAVLASNSRLNPADPPQKSLLRGGAAPGGVAPLQGHVHPHHGRCSSRTGRVADTSNLCFAFTVASREEQAVGVLQKGMSSRLMAGAAPPPPHGSITRTPTVLSFKLWKHLRQSESHACPSIEGMTAV